VGCATAARIGRAGIPSLPLAPILPSLRSGFADASYGRSAGAPPAPPQVENPLPPPLRDRDCNPPQYPATTLASVFRDEGEVLLSPGRQLEDTLQTREASFGWIASPGRRQAAMSGGQRETVRLSTGSS